MEAAVESDVGMASEASLKVLIETAKNPVLAAKERTKNRAIGCPITDVPFEIIHAAGYYPVAIFGHRGPAGPGREHVQSFACSYSRSVLDMALDGTLDFLKGMVVPFICDTTRAIDFVLRYMKTIPYLECYRPPKSLTGPGARDYTIGELTRLKESLESFAGAEIDDAKLSASIKTYNEARAELRRLAPMRESDPETFYAICRSFLTLPVEEFIELASDVIIETEPKKSGVPLVFAAKVAEPADLPKVLTGLGARIVADDLVTGSRLFALDVDEKKPPMEALADRQINNIPFVGLLQGPVDRPDYLVRLAKETGAAGVILSVQKFCEPFEIDIPEVRERLKREGIPTLVIETDYEPVVSGALRTRIEAFLEMLRHG